MPTQLLNTKVLLTTYAFSMTWLFYALSCCPWNLKRWTKWAAATSLCFQTGCCSVVTHLSPYHRTASGSNYLMIRSLFVTTTTSCWDQWRILAEKSASVSNNSAPFRDASPPTDLSGEKSVSILVKTFFFFFFFFLFGDHLNLGEKNVWISDFGRPFFFFFFFWRPPEFGRKKRLNFRFRPKNHSQFWWRHPNFWGFVLQFPPPPAKIFWIRHGLRWIIFAPA